MLQKVPKKRRGGDNAKTSATRALFITAYERTFGNISASCEYAGISRITFYRWMKSKSRVNLRFQKKIKELEPAERKLDFLEGALMSRVAAGDTKAIIYGLNKLAKSRGYHEKPMEKSEDQIVNETLNKVAKAFQIWLGDHPQSPPEEKNLWMERFAKNAGVETEELARHLENIQEFGSIQ